MLNDAKEILKNIETHGFEAYIVGGFVRDYCTNRKSLDVDICTSATPKDLSTIFEGAIIPTETYGAVTLLYKKVRYEITTYRREISYNDYRRPGKIEYIDNLLEDLQRRDFTMNTLCINSKGEIIDLLAAKDDLNNKLIRTVIDPNISFKLDVLRILRAVRFATTLNFTLDGDVKKSIIDNGYLLKNLSYERKKEELTKIFTSSNVMYGVFLLTELKLDEHLEISNLSSLKIVDDILGIWAQLDVLEIYPFNKTEREIISKVRESLNKEIDNYMLYENGLYIASIIASIKGIDKKEVSRKYDSLPIKSRNEIKLNVMSLCDKLKIEPNSWIKEAYLLLEREILDGSLENNEKAIQEFIINHQDLLVKSNS